MLVSVDTSKVTNTCGCASFLEAEDHANPTVIPLPLPWNRFYKKAWKNFIQAAAGKYVMPGTYTQLPSPKVPGGSSRLFRKNSA